MFVYLLCHATKPQFKIGKAKDIYQRIHSIGGIREFNIKRSWCLQLSTEEEALRQEKILHRSFARWNLAPDDTNRYPGDTEQFDIACLDRVLQFLSTNADLNGNVTPKPLPPQPECKNFSLTQPYV